MKELKKEYEKRFIDSGMNETQLNGANSVWEWIESKLTEREANRFDALVREGEADVLLAVGDRVLKRIEVFNRNADQLCNGCVFQHLNECLMITNDDLKCEIPIDNNGIVVNKHYIWELRPSK